MPSHRSTAEREALTRKVLAMPIETSHATVSAQCGIQRETVRKIRFGTINADVALDMERYDKDSFKRTCPQCQHWGRERCTLGIPEAQHVLYARGCGAYADAWL